MSRIAYDSLRKATLAGAGSLGLLALGAWGLGCFVFRAPRHHGPPSDHFDGERFSNQEPVRPGGLRKVLKWMATRQPGFWPEPHDAPFAPPPPERVGEGGLRVTWINHSTTLLQLDGVNVLTDPIWSARTSPVSFAGPERVRPPGLRLEDLPPIDVVLISHNHYDHLDLDTLRRLHERWRPAILTGLGNEALLAKHGIPDAATLDWWQSETFAGLRITAVPARHWSNRGLCDRAGTLWMGFVLHGRGGPVYFAGDSGEGPHFAQIRERFGPVRLALLPIGAYKPEWFMHEAHIGPAEALSVHERLEAGTSVAIHHGTFPLGDDGQTEAADELRRLLAERSQGAPRFWVLGFGEGRDVPPR